MSENIYTKSMKFNLFKPNSKNTGCLMSFEIGKNKDGSPCWFINAVQQASWNDSTKTGSFKENVKNPQKSAVVKMNANEAGEMLSSLKSRIPVQFFHKFGEGNTIIKWTPWDKDRKIKEQGGEVVYKSPAFGLTLSKNAASVFKIVFEAGETEVLAVLLDDLIKQDLFYAKEAYKKEEQPAPPKQEEKKQEAASSEWEDEDPDSSIPF